MTGPLIDKTEAFTLYFSFGTDRSLLKLYDQIRTESPENTPSYDTLKDWSKKYSWQSRVLLMDKAVADGLIDSMVPQWIELKAEMLDILLEQIRKGHEKGIEPENVRDMTLLIKELRSMLGDDIKKLDLKAELDSPERIEFVFYDPKGVRRDVGTKEPTESQPGDENDKKINIMLPNNGREL